MNVTERFERKLVLNSSRGLLLGLGGLSFTAAIVAVLYFAYGLIPAVKHESPPPPSMPQLVQVSEGELRARLPKEEEKEPEHVEGSTPQAAAEENAVVGGSSTEGESDPLVPYWAQIHTFFPGAKAPWKDRRVSFCARKNYWGGGCARWGSRTVAGFETRLRGQMGGASLTARTRYLEAVFDLLSAVPAEKQEKFFSRYLKVSGDVPTLTEFANELERLLVFVPESWTLYLMKGLVKSLSDGLVTSSFVTALQRARDVAATVPDDHRTDALLLTARFIVGGVQGSPMPDAVVENMKTLVGQVEESLRLQAVIEFRRAFREKTERAQKDYRVALARVSQEEERLERAYQSAVARKGEIRHQGLIAMGVTLAAVAVVGWLLALLAIERNTRALLALGQVSKGRQAATTE